MRKRMMQMAICFMVVPSLFAQVNQSMHTHNVDELNARIERTREHDRAHLYAELAHALVETANLQYSSNHFDLAEATVRKVLDNAEKATALVLANDKNIKKVEIELRETSRRLLEIKRTLGVEDQAIPKETAEQIEKMRLRIFDKMFGEKKKK
jgi:hypothetical protein